MNFRKWVAGTVGLLLATAACKRSESANESPPVVPAVARVGKRAITLQRFQARFEEQPAFIRSRYASAERKKEFLDSMVRMELLVQEARRQGLEQDPEVQETVEKLLIQKLLQKHAETTSTPPTEEQLQKYYQEHASEFSRPERVRISHLFLTRGKGEAEHAKTKAEAARLLAELRRMQEASPNALAELAAKRSAGAAAPAQVGEPGLQTREGPTHAWGPVFADAVFSLRTPGDVSEVTTEHGIHLVRLAERQPELKQSFEQARSRIESRLLLEGRSRSVEELVATLKQRIPVEVDERVLETMDLNAKTREPRPAAGAQSLSAGM